MRIALLSWESKHSIAVGGLAEHVTELAAALQERGHEVHLFTRIDDGQTGYDCIDGVHYHRCSYERHSDFLTDNRRMCDSLAWNLVEAESYLGSPFDVVHAHDWLCVGAMAHIKDSHRRRVMMTIHSTEYGRCGNQLYDGHSQRIREIEWAGAYVAERVICVSGALQREVQELYSVPNDKMHVIYNGIDVRRFDVRVDTRSARRQHTIGVDDPMVLFAGRMTWQKGPDILVEALPTVLRDHPRAKFVFAGDGDMRSGLEKRVARLGVASSTRFVGYRTGRELVTLFKSADLVCVPSRNEPFGIVILEAWSARKPVVATRNGGPAEFVTDHATGLTVSDDRHAISWGVGTILANKTQRQRMGRNGRREAETRFSWKTVAAQTEHVYESMLNDRVQAQSSAPIEEVLGMARQRNQKTADKTFKTTRTGTATSAKPAKKTVAKTTRITTGSTRETTNLAEISKPVVEVTGQRLPAHAEIGKRAYEIYLARGATPGHAEEDWLQAERELCEER